MLDVLFRALTHPREYAGIFQKRSLTFIEQQHEGERYYSYIFRPTQSFDWHAGQHGVLFLPTSKHDKGLRPYSVASSPHEKVVRFGTMIPEPHSEFKEVLNTLTPGAEVVFRGPFGEFHASGKTQHIIGIAGGIGITPFRAIAYDIAHGHLPDTRLTLIYSATAVYPFRATLDQWMTQTDNLDIIYTRTPEETQAAITNQWNVFGNAADYYISGSPGLITGLTSHCRSLGVRHIVSDPFKGY